MATLKSIKQDGLTGDTYIEPDEKYRMANGEINWWLVNGGDVIPDERHIRLRKACLKTRRLLAEVCPRIGKQLNECPGHCMFYGYTTTEDDSGKYTRCPVYCMSSDADLVALQIAKQETKNGHLRKTFLHIK